MSIESNYHMYCDNDDCQFAGELAMSGYHFSTSQDCKDAHRGEGWVFARHAGRVMHFCSPECKRAVVEMGR